MTHGTFQIAITLDGQSRREHPYVDSFESNGEVWVIHRRLDATGYAVSHKASGYAIPRTVSADDPKDAKIKAMAVLAANADRISKVIEEVMK